MATIYQTSYPIKLQDDNHTYDERIYLGWDGHGDPGENAPIMLDIDTKQKRGKPRVFVSASLPYEVALELGNALVELAEELLADRDKKASGRVEYIATFAGTDYVQVVDAEKFGGIGFLIDDGCKEHMIAKYPEMPIWYDPSGAEEVCHCDECEGIQL